MRERFEKYIRQITPISDKEFKEFIETIANVYDHLIEMREK